MADTDFTPDEAAWLAQVDKALKGAARETLARRSEDGAVIAPLYPRAREARPLSLRPVGQPWVMVSRIDLPQPEAANAQALEDLVGGANGLSLVLAGKDDPRGGGLTTGAGAEGLKATLATVLRDVYLDLVHLRLELPAGATATLADGIAALAALAAERGLSAGDLDVALVQDTLAQAYVADREGGDALSESLKAQLAAALKACAAAGVSWPVAAADGRVWHDLGATAGQELALTLATRLAQFRALEAAGVAEDRWTSLSTLTLAADADQQETLAKARAARLLDARLVEACGLATAPLRLHMETSWRMLSQRDPFVNMLRNTVAGFSAAVGGADSVCVLPHTQALGLPDGFARRLARNTQSILMDESHLARISDPAAGSGALEARTRDLAEAAWGLFQQIEAAGGLASSAGLAKAKAMLEEANARRAAKLAKLAQPLVGVSSFPNLGEAPVKVLAPAPDLQSLGFIRLAAPFEALRDAADASAASAPHVFLAALGRLSQFSARAAFATNALAAGGLRTADPAEGAIEAQVAAFKASGATMACLVGSDALYAEEGPALVAALKQAGATHVYLAGRPGPMAEAFAAAGLDTALYSGCDLLALLREAHARLGLVAQTQEAAR
ncbi:methylmalonyl-CoA mutase family protein [Roseibium aestuarii]|uniref:Methylmalonyl-CoA mutase family protein n=1 Tax=Roseibium aestuarii TaxID=2600299 RepID=A0ABW4JUG8_9HYPH|nr:methylmalonyl-CoA mutase family protein [Roseibium aestuarii]